MWEAAAHCQGIKQAEWQGELMLLDEGNSCVLKGSPTAVTHGRGASGMFGADVEVLMHLVLRNVATLSPAQPLVKPVAA